MSRVVSLRSWIAVFALCLLALPATAGGPLDLGDGSPRTVLVEVDQEATDFALIGGAYSLPVDAIYSSAGGVATVTITGATVEALVDKVFAGLATVVLGSFSDYVVQIDAASGEVLAATVSGQISSPLGNLGVVQTASSTMTAGFDVQDILGAMIPVFCTSGAACTLVPGLPFDPATGAMNAVGLIDTGLITAFSPFGDLRLSEKGLVDCSTAVDKASYSAGDALLASLDVDNNDAIDRALEMKVWLEIPNDDAFSVFNVGADSSLVIPAGGEIGFANTQMFVVDPSTPSGTWAVGCRVLDVTTGEVLGEDRSPFTIN